MAQSRFFSRLYICASHHLEFPTFSQYDQKTLVHWTTDCAENVLSLIEKTYRRTVDFEKRLMLAVPGCEVK